MKVIEISATWGCAPTIDLGQRGENLATQVRFNFAGWAEEFGAPGAVELYVRRAGETTPYPVALTIEDTVAVWPVSAIDTHIIGLGEAELVYLIDGAVVKTAVYGTAVEPDIGAPAGTPPDPYESWMEALGEMAAGTLINAQRAETAQEASEAAQTGAETAQEAAEAAQTGAEAAHTAAEASQTAAEAAQTGAETAQTRAESAATNAANSASQSLDSATAAAASAATAQSAASTATQKATEAASSASSAATSASTATQKATAAANSATSAQNWALDAAQDATTASSASDDAQRYATNASASATAAANSASAAAASASAAAASETAAGNSATAASASETAAEAAQAAAEAVLESIPQDYSALSDEVDGLKSAIISTSAAVKIDTLTQFEIGTINSSSGSSTSSNKRARTQDRIYIALGAHVTASGYKIATYRYGAASGSYDRITNSLAEYPNGVDITPGWYRFVFSKLNDSTVSDEDLAAIQTAAEISQRSYAFVDETLYTQGEAADANATRNLSWDMERSDGRYLFGGTWGVGRLNTSGTAESDKTYAAYTYSDGLTLPAGTLIMTDPGWCFRLSYNYGTSDRTHVEDVSYVILSNDARNIRISVSRIDPDTTESAVVDTWKTHVWWCGGLSEYERYKPHFFSMAMFQTWGVVGDSYGAGGHGRSWGSIAAGMLGNRDGFVNFSQSGVSTRTWLTSSNCYDKMMETDPREFYWLHLGINDAAIVKTTPEYLGSIADISTGSYEDYPDTFYGNYGHIIEAIQAHAPNALFVMATCVFGSAASAMSPTATTNIPAVNAAIKEIAQHYGIPCVDILEDVYIRTYWYSRMMGSGGTGTHPVVFAYPAMAQAYMRGFGKCALENYQYFRAMTFPD